MKTYEGVSSVDGTTLNVRIGRKTSTEALKKLKDCIVNIRKLDEKQMQWDGWTVDTHKAEVTSGYGCTTKVKNYNFPTSLNFAVVGTIRFLYAGKPYIINDVVLAQWHNGNNVWWTGVIEGSSFVAADYSDTGNTCYGMSYGVINRGGYYLHKSPISTRLQITNTSEVYSIVKNNEESPFKGIE